jgi:ERF superfamily
MGAALTYARRYALFTMVGIAGEDDLDAPPDATNDGAAAHKAVDTCFAPNPSPAPIHPGQLQTRNSNPPIREKLGAEESAAIRAQLVREIQTLSEDELQARAIGILKAKNRLSVHDAKQVEDVFEARMALQDASMDASTAGEPTSGLAAPTSSQPIAASTQATKPVRPRGRPRKVKAAAAQSSAQPAQPKPTIGDNPAPTSTPLQIDAAPAKIQKSELTIGEPRRHRDKDHLKFVASQPCLVCGRSPADAHHLRFTQLRALGRKVSDEFTVPLCRTHHRDNHSFGDEVAWWDRRAIDPIATSRLLWVSTRRIEQ